MLGPRLRFHIKNEVQYTHPDVFFLFSAGYDH